MNRLARLIRTRDTVLTFLCRAGIGSVF